MMAEGIIYKPPYICPFPDEREIPHEGIGKFVSILVRTGWAKPRQLLTSAIVIDTGRGCRGNLVLFELQLRQFQKRN